MISSRGFFCHTSVLWSMGLFLSIYLVKSFFALEQRNMFKTLVEQAVFQIQFYGGQRGFMLIQPWKSQLHIYPYFKDSAFRRNSRSWNDLRKNHPSLAEGEDVCMA